MENIVGFNSLGRQVRAAAVCSGAGDLRHRRERHRDFLAALSHPLAVRYRKTSKSVRRSRRWWPALPLAL
jgi:hypothetical protein